jgi:hypothetical protein
MTAMYIDRGNGNICYRMKSRVARLCSRKENWNINLVHWLISYVSYVKVPAINNKSFC